MNSRKAAANMFRIQMPQIQIHGRILRAAKFQLLNNGAGYYISGRKLAHGMVLRHESHHLIVSQVRSFAAQCF